MLRIHTLSIASAIVLGLAFLIMFLVSLSLPIIEDIYILSLQTTPAPSVPTSGSNTATLLRFGVWGFCAYGSFNEPTIMNNNGTCYGPMLGYTIPENVLQLTGYPSIVQGIDTGVTVLLILHPISATLSLLTATFALLSIRRRTHNFAIACLVLSIITTLVTIIVFAIDLVIIGIAQAEVPGLTNGDFNPGFGPVVWMVLIATLLTFIGMVIESVKVCGCCGVGRMHHHIRGIDDAREHRYQTKRQTALPYYPVAPQEESPTEASLMQPSVPEQFEGLAATKETKKAEEEEQDWWWYWPPSWWSSQTRMTN